MNEQDVTLVTRNPVAEEMRVVFDLAIWAVAMYYFTHPDAFDKLRDRARGYWGQVVHNLSVWTARQDIRSLPETEE